MVWLGNFEPELKNGERSRTKMAIRQMDAQKTLRGSYIQCIESTPR
jgi:hypothetical protein